MASNTVLTCGVCMSYVKNKTIVYHKCVQDWFSVTIDTKSKTFYPTNQKGEYLAKVIWENKEQLLLLKQVSDNSSFINQPIEINNEDLTEANSSNNESFPTSENISQNSTSSSEKVDSTNVNFNSNLLQDTDNTIEEHRDESFVKHRAKGSDDLNVSMTRLIHIAEALNKTQVPVINLPQLPEITMNSRINYLYYQWLLECLPIINLEIHRQRKMELILSIATLVNVQLKKKRRKKYWMAQIFKDRQRYGFYHAILPTVRLEDFRFHNYTRMTTIQFEELLSIVGNDLKKQYVVREPISEEQRLILTLRYLASGDSMTSLSYQYLISLSSIINIIRETCSCIWEHLCPIVLAKCNAKDWIKIANDFAEKWNFPHCVGAIDGKHVVIQCPDNAGSEYFNYKGNHSIILLAVSDANYIIRYVDIGVPGRQGDANVLRNSAIGLLLERKQFNLPPPEPLYKDGPILPYVLVGDEAFPLTDYMMRPYPGKNEITLEKRIYNYRLSRARRTVENVFGILANQWRILRRPIIAKVSNTTKMVQAIVCLHNWLRKHDIEQEQETYVTQELANRLTIEGDIEEGSWRKNVKQFSLFNIKCTRAKAYSLRAAHIRDEFCRYLNEEGEVGWQNIQIYQ